MEPFVPIPGKPPRKVVIDRQRKLFASLNIEELLLELVRPRSNHILNINNRVLIIKIHKRHRQTGFPSSPSTTLNMTVVSHQSGSPTATMKKEISVPFRVKDSGEMRTAAGFGAQC